MKGGEGSGALESCRATDDGEVREVNVFRKGRGRGRGEVRGVITVKGRGLAMKERRVRKVKGGGFLWRKGSEFG